MVVTALRLAGDGDGELRFVDDQHGSPTFTADLAPAIVTLGLDRRPGIFHVDQQRRHDLVGLRAGGLGRGRRRPRAGAADQHRRARPAPPGAPPRQLGARQHGAAPERAAGPAGLAGRTGPARGRPCVHSRRRRHEPLGQRPQIAHRWPSSAPAMWACPRRPRWPISATTSCWPSASTSKLSALRSGRMPIVEAGLDELVAEGVAAGNLSFTESAVDAVVGAEFVFLCVPDPPERRRLGRPVLRRGGRQGDRDPSAVLAPSSSTSRPSPWARPTWSSG